MQKTARVLILCTGGTMAMSYQNGLLSPQKGNLQKFIRTHPSLYRGQLQEDSPWMTASLGLVKVAYRIRQLEELIDSANATIDHWIKIGKVLEQEYQAYDGFVVVHGTDTLAYTASAISFAIQNNTKPVVFTGSQVPISNPITDAFNNLVESLAVAGSLKIAQVVIVFHHNIFRANRTTKQSSESYGSFVSPKISPLGTFGVNLILNKPLLIQPTQEKTKFYTSFEKKIFLLKVFPSNQWCFIKRLLLESGLKGMVVQSYGSGNISDQLSDIILQAIRNGIVVMVVSQIIKGNVLPIYKTAEALRKGCIICKDMTFQSAYTKLSLVLGLNLPVEQTIALLNKNLRGEMTECQ